MQVIIEGQLYEHIWQVYCREWLWTEEEMAFAVQKEEDGGIQKEQKIDSVIQMGMVIKKKTRASD